MAGEVWGVREFLIYDFRFLISDWGEGLRSDYDYEHDYDWEREGKLAASPTGPTSGLRPPTSDVRLRLGGRWRTVRGFPSGSGRRFT